jgi:hypothetical protein
MFSKQEWTDFTTPKVPFDYRIKTTNINGGVWVADLLDPQGVVVGTVENDGNDGADRFRFNTTSGQKHFYEAVYECFGHNDEEPASWYMQELEEEAAE